MRMPRGITKVGDDLYELKLASGQVARFNADDAHAVWMLSEKLFLDGEIRYRIEMAERDIPRCGETYDLGRLNDHGRAVIGPLTREEVDWLVEEAFAIRLYEGEELTLDQVVANAAEGLFDQRRREEDERSFSEMCERLGADERVARKSVMRDAAADWPCGPASEALVRSLASKPGPEGAPEADMDEVLRCERARSNASGQEPLDSQALAAIRAVGQEEGRAADGPDGRGDR